MANPRPQFWNLDRLRVIRRILRKISSAEAGTDLRSIPGDSSLIDRVYNIYREECPRVTRPQVNQALTLFGKMEILDPGKPGGKKEGFKRTFNPKKRLTPQAIRRGFAKMGITWRPPSS